MKIIKIITVILAVLLINTGAAFAEKNSSDLTAYEKNLFIAGNDTLFIYDMEFNPSSVYVNTRKLDNNEYELKRGMVLIKGSVFENAGKYTVFLSNQMGFETADNNIIFKTRESTKYLYSVTTENGERDDSVEPGEAVAPNGTSTAYGAFNASSYFYTPEKVRIAFADDSKFDKFWSWGVNFKGEYRLYYGTIGHDMMNSYEIEVSDSRGKNISYVEEDCEGYGAIGDGKVFVFSGNEKEYITVRSDKNKPGKNGKRLAANVVKLEMYYNNDEVIKKFYGEIKENLYADVEERTQNDITNTQRKIYNDTKDHWAEEYINTLYEKGYLNNEKVFRPDEQITREEFVEILAKSQGLTEDNKNIFKDGNNGYVNSAMKGGLINGISETEFGYGKYITREDIAVILYRILKTENEFTSEFDDNGEISDYALNAVGCLSQKGIITGFENNTFKPKNSCLRSEAAVLICRFLLGE